MNLKAIIPAGQTESMVNGLHQWDYGCKLEIHAPDLPAMVEVHFACAGMESAVVRSCDAPDGVAVAAIPDRCLEQTSPIIAWVYAVGEDAGTTIKTIILPIMARTRPQYPPAIPETASNAYTEAVAAMNRLVEQVEESVNEVAGAVYTNVANDIRVGTLQVQRATQADYAERDGLGEVIHEVYASRQDLGNGGVKAKLANHADFADSARCAEQDADGNNIADTYMKKGNICRSFTRLSQEITTDNHYIPFAIGAIPEGKELTSINAVAFKIVSQYTEETYHFHGIVDYPYLTTGSAAGANGPYLPIDCPMSVTAYEDGHIVGKVEARFYAEGDTLKMTFGEAQGFKFNAGSYEAIPFAYNYQIFVGTLKSICVYYN